MSIVSKTKDPADKLDYLIDWRNPDAALFPPGTVPGLAEDENISTSTWVAYDPKWVATDDVTVHDELNSHTTTTATGWVSGGTRGADVFFTNHIVTDQGRELSCSIKLKIREQ